jgi:hypothetical protein
MWQTAAYKILAGEIAAFRSLSFDDLLQFVGETQSRRIRGDDGNEFATSLTVCWLNPKSRGIIVYGWIAVDDCGPMRRLDDEFIVPPPADT